MDFQRKEWRFFQEHFKQISKVSIFCSKITFENFLSFVYIFWWTESQTESVGQEVLPSLSPMNSQCYKTTIQVVLVLCKTFICNVLYLRLKNASFYESILDAQIVLVVLYVIFNTLIKPNVCMLNAINEQ